MSILYWSDEVGGVSQSPGPGSGSEVFLLSPDSDNQMRPLVVLHSCPGDPLSLFDFYVQESRISFTDVESSRHLTMSQLRTILHLITLDVF